MTGVLLVGSKNKGLGGDNSADSSAADEWKDTPTNPSQRPKHDESTGLFRIDDSGDHFVEKLDNIIGADLSNFASHIGRFMVIRGFDEDFIRYITGMVNEKEMTSRSRTRATNILKKWLEKSRNREDRIEAADRVFSCLEQMVSSEGMYISAIKLIGASGVSRMGEWESDMQEISRYSGIMARLPEDVVVVFQQMVDSAIERNYCVPDHEHLRYSRLGDLLESFSPFSARHHRGTYELVRKVADKDKKGILFSLYRSIGNIPRSAPRNAIGMISRVLDFLPPGSAQDEYDVDRIRSFIDTVSNSLSYHAACEIETFLELESGYLNFGKDDWQDRVDRLSDILDKSVERREVASSAGGAGGEVIRACEANGNGSSFPDYDLEGIVGRYADEMHDLIDNFGSDVTTNSRRLLRIFRKIGKGMVKAGIVGKEEVPREKPLDECSRSLGTKYLEFSRAIRKGPCNSNFRDPVSHFAKDIQALYGLKVSEQEMGDFMSLYKRYMLGKKGANGGDETPLSDVEQSKLNAMLYSISRHATQLIEYATAESRLEKAGPEPCPPELKEKLFRDFGVEVNEIWDLRKSQFLLYLGKQSTEEYEHWSKNRMDRTFTREIVRQMRDELRILERRINMSALGCGTAISEIELYEELVNAGYSVHLDLYDKSREMLLKAVSNWFPRGIRPMVFEKDVLRLDYADLEKGRQVIVVVRGGTFFNWVDRFDFVDNVGRIFDQRDKTRPSGEYVLKRYNSSHKRLLDFLWIEGDEEKDISLYESLSSKRFIASGLNSGFHLTDDALMRDGKYCHTTYLDSENNELRCIFLVTHKAGRFRKHQAIRVIDSGIMEKEEFEKQMRARGFGTYFIRGPRKSAVALCYRQRESGIIVPADYCNGPEGAK